MNLDPATRKTLLDHIKVTGGVYDKTFQEIWKGEKLTQSAEYHAGAWQAIHAMQDFVERLP